MLARRFALLALVACQSPSPAPAKNAPEPARAPADAPPPPNELAVDDTAPPPPAAAPAAYGIRWRIPLAADEPPLAVGAALVVTHGDQITSVDSRTGAQLASTKLAHSQLLAVGGVVVARTEKEEIGLDPATLAPVWRAPVGYRLFGLGGYLVETLSAASHPMMQARRAADGSVAWTRSGPAFDIVPPRLDGDTLYLPLDLRSFEAADLATGATRWKRDGFLAGVGGGRVAVVAEIGHDGAELLDREGHALYRTRIAPLLAGDVAYTYAAHGLTAIDLRTNTVRWRAPGLVVVAADATWVYAAVALEPGPSYSDAPHAPLVVLDAATGARAGTLALGRAAVTPVVTPDGAAVPLGMVPAWLYGLGAPPVDDPPRTVRARGCLVVHGCRTNTSTPRGAPIVVAGVAGKLDARGCFDLPIAQGLAPVPVDYPTSPIFDFARLDTGFPAELIFDGTRLALEASYIGGGCHDSQPGGFP